MASMLAELDRALARSGSAPGAIGHTKPARPANPSGERRLVALTVVLSEPLESQDLDWPATLASLVRLSLVGTTVNVIETWRNDR